MRIYWLNLGLRLRRSVGLIYPVGKYDVLVLPQVLSHPDGVSSFFVLMSKTDHNKEAEKSNSSRNIPSNPHPSAILIAITFIIAGSIVVSARVSVGLVVTAAIKGVSFDAGVIVVSTIIAIVHADTDITRSNEDNAENGTGKSCKNTNSKSHSEGSVVDKKVSSLCNHKVIRFIIKW